VEILLTNFHIILELSWFFFIYLRTISFNNGIVFYWEKTIYNFVVILKSDKLLADFIFKINYILRLEGSSQNHDFHLEDFPWQVFD